MNAFNRMAFEQALEHQLISLSRSSEAPVINALFDWATGLDSVHADWPGGLPEPGSGDPYCEETDALFLFAIRYIMYHEVAHLLFTAILTISYSVSVWAFLARTSAAAL